MKNWEIFHLLRSFKKADQMKILILIHSLQIWKLNVNYFVVHKKIKSDNAVSFRLNTHGAWKQRLV